MDQKPESSIKTMALKFQSRVLALYRILDVWLLSISR